MQDDKAQNIDEKTARVFEEMDKSLHNMEQSLGMDHLVVARILDSYAVLLRQNNLRPLDALNMEARAKAIRAKHNREEAEEQSKGLSPTVQEKSFLSAGQLKGVVWVLSILVVGGIAYEAIDVIKATNKIKIRQASKTVVTQPATPENQKGDPPDNSVGDDTNKSADDQNDASPNQPNGTSKTVSLLQIAEEMARIKSLAKEQLSVGQEAEKNQDYQRATQAYVTAVKAEEDASRAYGRQVYTEEMAQCYEGYGRMAEANSHPEINANCQKAAASIRSQITGQ